LRKLRLKGLGCAGAGESDIAVIVHRRDREVTSKQLDALQIFGNKIDIEPDAKATPLCSSSVPQNVGAIIF
jgi:hypothetical protein